MASSVEARVMMIYGKTGAALVSAKKSAREAAAAIEQLTKALADSQDKAQKAEKELKLISDIIWEGGKPEKETFPALLRRFMSITGLDTNGVGALFGYTGSAISLWKNGKYTPKASTWQKVASVMEAESEGIIKEKDILDALQRTADHLRTVPGGYSLEDEEEPAETEDTADVNEATPAEEPETATETPTAPIKATAPETAESDSIPFDATDIETNDYEPVLDEANPEDIGIDKTQSEDAISENDIFGSDVIDDEEVFF